MSDETVPAAREIAAVCDELKALLLRKNAAYGNSALEPMRVFSRASAEEQILVRLDDKLSRLTRGHALPDESLADTVDDLLGYLVLLKVARRRRAARAAQAAPPPDAMAPSHRCLARLRELGAHPELLKVVGELWSHLLIPLRAHMPHRAELLQRLGINHAELNWDSVGVVVYPDGEMKWSTPKKEYAAMTLVEALNSKGLLRALRKYLNRGDG